MSEHAEARAAVLRLERACREAAHQWGLTEQLEVQRTLMRLRELVGLPQVLAAGRVQWAWGGPEVANG